MSDGGPTADSNRHGSVRGRDAVRRVLQDAAARDPNSIDPQKLLGAVLAGSDDPGGDLAWLVAYDLDKGVCDVGVPLLHFVATDKDALAAAGAGKVRKSARTALLKALRDRRVPDDRKLPLAPLFEMLGGRLSEGDYRSFFSDYDAVVRSIARRVASSVMDTPEGIEGVFEAIGLMETGRGAPSERDVAQLLQLHGDAREANPAAAAALLGALVALEIEHGRTGEETAAMVDLLAKDASPRAAWCIDELGRWPAAGPIGARCRALAGALREKGVLPGGVRPPEFVSGLFSAVDGAGSRNLTIITKSADGGLDGLVLMPNDQVGIKDAWCAFGDGREAEARFKSAKEIVAVRCSMELARELVADALAIHEQTRRPPPGRFFIYRPVFGAEPIVPRRRSPDLGAYGVPGPEAASPVSEREAFDMLDCPGYRELWFCSDFVYETISKMTRGGRQRLSDIQLEKLMVEVLPQERERLLSRLAANLEILALAGKASRRENRLAFRVWRELSKGDANPAAIPFLRALCRRTAEIVGYNLAMGFRSQAQANRVVEEMEEGRE